MDNTQESEKAAMVGPGVSFTHLPVLDGVRGIAILTVLAFHLPKPAYLQSFVKGGFLGVDIFFVLSGFLITAILISENGRTGRIDLRNFYIRRFLRLVPALWLFLVIVYFFGQYLMRPQMITATYRDGNFLYSFLYVINWSIAWDGRFAGHLNHIWSLSIEEQFYILWAIGLFAMFRLRWSRERITWFTIGAILLVVVWRAARAASGTSSHVLYYSTDTRIDHLLIGCVASVIYFWQIIPQKNFASRRFDILMIGALFTGAIIFFSFSDLDSSFYYGFGALFALSTAIVILWLVARTGTKLHAILESRPLTWLGMVSYGVYLWHFIAFDFGKTFTARPARYGAWIALALLVPAASFYLVERPFLKLKDRFSATGL